MKRAIWAFLAAALIVAVPLFALQETPKQEKPKESRTAYLRRIFEKDRATYGDACRAVLSLVKNEHSDAEFAVIQADLVGQAVARPDWGFQEASLLTKG